MGKSSVSLVILLGVLFSIYCFIFGESGVLERIALQKVGYAAGKRINSLRSEEAALQATLKDYREGRISGEDLFKTGFIPEGGRAVFFKGISRETGPAGIAEGDQHGSIVDIKYLRILWGVISVVSIVVFVIRIRRQKAE